MIIYIIEESKTYLFIKYYNAKILHYMSKYFHNYTISLHIHFTFCNEKRFYILFI